MNELTRWSPAYISWESKCELWRHKFATNNAHQLKCAQLLITFVAKTGLWQQNEVLRTSKQAVGPENYQAYWSCWLVTGKTFSIGLNWLVCDELVSYGLGWFWNGFSWFLVLLLKYGNYWFQLEMNWSNSLKVRNATQKHNSNHLVPGKSIVLCNVSMLRNA